MKRYLKRQLFVLVIIGVAYVLFFVALPQLLKGTDSGSAEAATEQLLKENYLAMNSLTQLNHDSPRLIYYLAQTTSRVNETRQSLIKAMDDGVNLKSGQSQSLKKLLQDQAETMAVLDSYIQAFDKVIAYDPSEDLLAPGIRPEELSRRLAAAAGGINTAMSSPGIVLTDQARSALNSSAKCFSEAGSKPDTIPVCVDSYEAARSQAARTVLGIFERQVFKRLLDGMKQSLSTL